MLYFSDTMPTGRTSDGRQVSFMDGSRAVWESAAEGTSRSKDLGRKDKERDKKKRDREKGRQMARDVSAGKPLGRVALSAGGRTNVSLCITRITVSTSSLTAQYLNDWMDCVTLYTNKTSSEAQRLSHRVHQQWLEREYLQRSTSAPSPLVDSQAPPKYVSGMV